MLVKKLEIQFDRGCRSTRIFVDDEEIKDVISFSLIQESCDEYPILTVGRRLIAEGIDVETLDYKLELKRS